MLHICKLENEYVQQNINTPINNIITSSEVIKCIFLFIHTNLFNG